MEENSIFSSEIITDTNKILYYKIQYCKVIRGTDFLKKLLIVPY